MSMIQLPNVNRREYVCKEKGIRIEFLRDTGVDTRGLVCSWKELRM